MLYPLGQIRVAGKITRAGLRQTSNSAQQKDYGSKDKRLSVKFRVARDLCTIFSDSFYAVFVR
jgi:hypothetical protein